MLKFEQIENCKHSIKILLRRKNLRFLRRTNHYTNTLCTRRTKNSELINLMLTFKLNNELTNIKKWLGKPFPFHDNYKQKIVTPILLSLLVMIGIIILNPSKNMDMFIRQMLDVFKYGFIIILITLIFNLILPEVFPNIFNTEKWNVQKTLVLFLVTVLTILT